MDKKLWKISTILNEYREDIYLHRKKQSIILIETET